MISRCKYCGDIAPQYSNLCDTCAFIESEGGTLSIYREIDEEDYYESDYYND